MIIHHIGSHPNSISHLCRLFGQWIQNFMRYGANTIIILNYRLNKIYAYKIIYKYRSISTYNIIFLMIILIHLTNFIKFWNKRTILTSLKDGGMGLKSLSRILNSRLIYSLTALIIYVSSYGCLQLLDMECLRTCKEMHD